MRGVQKGFSVKGAGQLLMYPGGMGYVTDAYNRLCALTAGQDAAHGWLFYFFEYTFDVEEVFCSVGDVLADFWQTTRALYTIHTA